ncbi:MAG: hypothetical protein OHK0039_33050 [Bacteroidia bacterium]
MRHLTPILLLGLILGLGACKTEGPDLPDFDRQAMLANYADNLIQPAYAALQGEVADLATAYAAFDQTLDTARLAALRTAWLEAALAWQAADVFNFGPAGEAGLLKSLAQEIGTFPVNRAQVETFIAAGDLTLNNFNRDTRGLPAIEYLLFGERQPVAGVTAALQDSVRRAYLGALIGHLQQRVDAVVQGWQGYRADFVANDGTDIGSATSQLYNAFVQRYEAIKNFKVGLPAGLRAGQTQPEPHLVESPFAGQSRALAEAHLAAVWRVYAGQGSSGDGSGLRDYLLAVTGGSDLVAATDVQWAAVQAALAQVPADQDLADLAAAEDPRLIALHTELQKHTRFFKSDMSSLLGIAITFSSGDGD